MEASDGILTIWDTAEVEVWVTRSIGNVIIIQGRLLKNGGDFILAMFMRLGAILSNNREANWCVCDDFNVVRSYEEQKSRDIDPSNEDFSLFNWFMDDNILFDLLLCGRNFTWFRGDGYYMSRLDRFLLSEEWCF